MADDENLHELFRVAELAYDGRSNPAVKIILPGLRGTSLKRANLRAP
jgi:hypothetical protein